MHRLKQVLVLKWRRRREVKSVGGIRGVCVGAWGFVSFGSRASSCQLGQTVWILIVKPHLFWHNQYVSINQLQNINLIWAIQYHVAFPLENRGWVKKQPLGSALFPHLYKTIFFYSFNWYNGRLVLFSGYVSFLREIGFLGYRRCIHSFSD